MLPREHRLTRSADFSAVMRQGTRAGTASVVVAVRVDPRSELPGRAWRAGFIVSKAVGNAVVRHRTSRRLRHAVAEIMRDAEIGRDIVRDKEPAGDQGRFDIVVRALAAAPGTPHQQLLEDLNSGVRRALRKWEKRQP